LGEIRLGEMGLGEMGLGEMGQNLVITTIFIGNFNYRILY